MKKLLLSIIFVLGLALASQANTATIPTPETNTVTKMLDVDLPDANPTCYKVTEVYHVHDQGDVIIIEVEVIIEEIDCPED